MMTEKGGLGGGDRRKASADVHVIIIKKKTRALFPTPVTIRAYIMYSPQRQVVDDRDSLKPF